jgi:hypothetical protein
MKRITMQPFVLAAMLLLGGGLAGNVAEADYSPAQIALFDTPHLANIAQPMTIQYDFSRDGAGDETIKDHVDVIVTEVMADGRRNLEFDFLSGPRHRNFPPIENFRGNPLIMLFLEHDVQEMSAATGGSALYFRNRIRNAFLVSAETESVTFEFDGRGLSGTRVVVSPFMKDPHLIPFPGLEQKSYEFLLSPEIPGGVYRIRSVTPDGGEPIEETVLFRDTVPES